MCNLLESIIEGVLLQHGSKVFPRISRGARISTKEKITRENQTKLKYLICNLGLMQVFSKMLVTAGCSIKQTEAQPLLQKPPFNHTDTDVFFFFFFSLSLMPLWYLVADELSEWFLLK